MKIIIEGNTGSEIRKQSLSLAEEYSHTPIKEDRDSILIMEMQEEIQFLKARIKLLSHHQKPMTDKDMYDDDDESEAEKIKMEEITMDNFLEHLNKKQHI